MKKLFIVMALGFTICLTACNKSGDTVSGNLEKQVTEQAATEAADTEQGVATEEAEVETETVAGAEDSQTEEDEGYTAFAEIMDQIYDIQAGTAGSSLRAEAVLEDFKTYMSKYGMDSASMVYESLANQWFDEKQEATGQDVRADFAECLDEFEAVAYDQDSDLEYDVYFSNIVSGMRYAVGED